MLVEIVITDTADLVCLDQLSHQEMQALYCANSLVCNALGMKAPEARLCLSGSGQLDPPDASQCYMSVQLNGLLPPRVDDEDSIDGAWLKI